MQAAKKTNVNLRLLFIRSRESAQTITARVGTKVSMELLVVLAGVRGQIEGDELKVGLVVA